MNQAIVNCARSWLGTRFHHQGRLKRSATHKGGVDCLGLLVGVAAELKLAAPDGSLLIEADERHYPHAPDTARLMRRLAQLLRPVPPEQISPGDILLLRVDGSPQHLAIASGGPEGPGIIHAYAPARAVVEHRLDAWWRERIEAVFRIF
jgi:cell wall-associated NlpC family hydrolase